MFDRVLNTPLCKFLLKGGKYWQLGLFTLIHGVKNQIKSYAFDRRGEKIFSSENMQYFDSKLIIFYYKMEHDLKGVATLLYDQVQKPEN